MFNYFFNEKVSFHIITLWFGFRPLLRDKRPFIIILVVVWSSPPPPPFLRFLAGFVLFNLLLPVYCFVVHCLYFQFFWFLLAIILSILHLKPLITPRYIRTVRTKKNTHVFTCLFYMFFKISVFFKTSVLVLVSERNN